MTGAKSRSRQVTKPPVAAKKKKAWRESKAHQRERAERIVALLDRTYPSALCSLAHRNPFELLIATILSAQCTDARVNLVTPALFAEAPTPSQLAALPLARVEELVHTTGFFRNKAKNIRGAAERICKVFGGHVPVEMDDLLSLPGVARKTANVVRGTAFGVATGIVVDTHVTRIANLLKLSTSRDAKRIEKDLMALIPKSHWIRWTHQVIEHGRQVCIARRPRCDACVLAPHCPSAVNALPA
ncbi:MAG TPA: endonuclease III [Planctomycetota bacterium]|jgi:endonuclease-3|nr:endonuclease III [Planctomycetota bacterium]